ncbi:hypothetical protein A2U01_0035611 [Trifolium medium]|uniref:Uncharacterized protein n=1 Tax=Trifolium medium TaxID=97028 RepID=A0A392PSQ4_9FABA|nr:hypothetical protein [Trifolium medium]
MMAESIERANMKRLTLTSHFEMKQEKLRREEEKKRQEKEEARKKLVSEDVAVNGSENMNVETSDQVLLDKGKAAVVFDPDPLVLKLQEDLAAQKTEQELLKEEVRHLTESQNHVLS